MENFPKMRIKGYWRKCGYPPKRTIRRRKVNTYIDVQLPNTIAQTRDIRCYYN